MSTTPVKSITTTANYAIFFSKRETLKAIICVLVGEQQFCKFSFFVSLRNLFSLCSAFIYLLVVCLSALHRSEKKRDCKPLGSLSGLNSFFSTTMPSMLCDYGSDYDVMEQEALKVSLAHCSSVN